MDTTEFVPFGNNYDGTHHRKHTGCIREFLQCSCRVLCDILAPDRKPCSKLEQVKGKKVSLIWFVPPSTMTRPEMDISYSKHKWPKCEKQRTLLAAAKSNSVGANTRYIGITLNINPKSVPVADL